LNNLLKKPLDAMPNILDKVRYFIANKPEERTFDDVIDRATTKVCKYCKNSTKCWVNNYNSTNSALASLQSTYTEFGAILEEDFPKYFSDNCLKLSSLKNQINQLNNNHSALSNDHSYIRKRDNVLYLYEFVPEIESRLYSEFHDKGIRVSSIIVVKNSYGNLEISLNVRSEFPIEEIVALCQAVTGRKMRVSELSESKDKRIYAKIVQRPSFEMEIGIALEAKDGNEECGDSFSISKISENKMVVTLSDGCGNGSVASKYSQTTSSLMKIFLEGGIPKNKAIDLVSSVLLLGRDAEKYATADIAIFDIFDGGLEIVKLGANSSYIVQRNEQKLERLSSSSLPVGVFRKTEIDNYKTKLSNGDYVIIMSDGVESPNELWISDFLDNYKLKNAAPQLLADKIIGAAKENTRFDDDKLVIVGRVLKT